MRSQRSYRSNFLIDLYSSFVIGFIELAEVWMLFRNVTSLGGFTFSQILLVFGFADLCYSLADMVMGHCDNLPTYLRAGTLDVFYLRPQPVLLQLITSDISLRRVARAMVGLGAMTIGLWINDVQWSPAHIGLLAMSLVCATAIYAGMYVWAAGAQFFLVQGAEMTNAFVYGGRYASTQVASVWSRPLKVVFGFFFPMAMTAYVPSLQLLGLPGPQWLPAWLAWCTPVFATWTWAMALLFWRLGLRHYQGGGG
ncbi:ABC transporter permease [Leekyejoonella antrihumi]|uniref:ABC transporter permease n=2 Tax=Leekyejoonella antrihumi TaxID=1660198 RepID=A0A563DX95_9MICO|nr:ABC transporter permease [Leekyejoonella antrihumi]